MCGTDAVREILHTLTAETLGIFAYITYNSPHSKREILNVLLTGLSRLEYRGYDSAGTA